MKKIARIVCWQCKRGNKTLRRIDELDYACEDCLVYGKPPIGNASKIYYEKS